MIRELPQWVDVKEKQSAARIALETTEVYRQSIELLYLVRVCR
jgi:hypothetical protein